MTGLDWGILLAYFLYIIALGLWCGRKSRSTEGYFLASRSLPWWAIGMSVMATQASAITFIGTTGQGYADGMRFIQFYFGMPVAMVILCVTLVPLFYRAKVYTAYEYLEKRFDARTRLLAAVLFLLSRGLALGVVVYAPSIVLSILLGWDIYATITVMTVGAAVYTVLGGIRAVIWTDVQQMVLILAGLAACPFVIRAGMPDGVSFGDSLYLAGISEHLRSVELSFNPESKYTLWSGLVGGTFLMLSYFGCDQSQVQRYLTGRSLRDSRLSLLLNAAVKIPIQFLVLFVGVLLFVFYQFESPPLSFNASALESVRQGPSAAEYEAVVSEYNAGFAKRRRAAEEVIAARRAADAEMLGAAKARYRKADGELREIRERFSDLAARATGRDADDTNYVFPDFIIRYLPAGLVGLCIAAMFAAAMSSMDSELNSLATASVMDVYRRHLRKDADEKHYLRISRVSTLLWAVVAGLFATYAGALGSLIEAVNKVGSYFYGSILGVFVLAVGIRGAKGRGAFWGLIAGMAAVCAVSLGTEIAFLWYNLIGCVVVVVVGTLLSLPVGGGGRLSSAREADQVGE